MSSKAFPMALFLDNSQLASHLSEKMHNPSNIDLLLECEDDQSYDLPQTQTVSNGLQLHTSRNVSMRISFSCAGRLSCQFCQCNFLSETHLMDHMHKFHNDNESGEEDGDDDVEDFQPVTEDPVADDDEGYDGSDDVLGKESPGEKLEIVKMEAVVPGLAKTAMMPPINDVVTTPVPANTNGAHCSPQPTSPVSVPTTPKPQENGVAEATNLKRKSSEMPPAPRLTLTIKKSKSSYEIQRDVESLVPVSPGMQMREENYEAQSDSANETIDVESSSPHSSPGSEKNDIQAMISGRKNNLVKFFCGQCDKGYVSKYALKRHLATHSDERPYVCSFQGCKGAFKLKSRLTDHIRYVHKRKTPRTVGRSKSLPDAATSTLARVLLSPEPLSGGGKPSAKTKLFKCTIPSCNREFRDSHNLASHMCLHTGYNPYKCPLCPYSTIQKNSLDWHMQYKHPQS